MSIQRRSLFILAASVVAVLLVGQWLGFIPWWGWTTRLVSPVGVKVYQWSIGVRQWSRVVWHSSQIIAESNYWRDRAEQWQQQVAQTAELKRQNDELSLLLQFNKDNKYNIVAARLLGSGATTQVGVRVIDRGTNQGLTAGQPVVSPLGSLIGVVKRVWASGAEVQLLDSPQSRVAVAPMGRSASGGILNGTYQLGLMLTQVRPDDPLAVGEIIGTSGLQEGLPRGLVVGTVRETWSSEGDLFKSAAVEPIVDLQHLTEAGVIIGP